MSKQKTAEKNKEKNLNAAGKALAAGPETENKIIDGGLADRAIAADDPGAIAIPYSLRRELEEIGKVKGFTADEIIEKNNYDIPALEAICNKENYPPDSWRSRWRR